MGMAYDDQELLIQGLSAIGRMESGPDREEMVQNIEALSAAILRRNALESGIASEVATELQRLGIPMERRDVLESMDGLAKLSEETNG